MDAGVSGVVRGGGMGGIGDGGMGGVAGGMGGMGPFRTSADASPATGINYIY